MTTAMTTTTAAPATAETTGATTAATTAAATTAAATVVVTTAEEAVMAAAEVAQAPAEVVLCRPGPPQAPDGTTSLSRGSVRRDRRADRIELPMIEPAHVGRGKAVQLALHLTERFI